MPNINASDNAEEYIAYEEPIDIINLQTTQNPYYTPTGGTSRLEHVSRREEQTSSCLGMCSEGLGLPGRP
jgi:uncharacterized ParB-like nuclease family protein